MRDDKFGMRGLTQMCIRDRRKVCQALAPRQVVVRLSDFKSSEYRDLKGGDKFEPHESSALLGWRGASRYYDPTVSYTHLVEIQC